MNQAALNINPETTPEMYAKSVKQFTVLQAGALILMTLLITIGAWSAVGYFFSDHVVDEKRIDAQLDYYKKQADIDPSKVENHINLGYTYFLKRENDMAMNEFNKAIELDKNFWGGYYNLGMVYADEDRLNEALSMFKKTTELSPRNGKGFLQLGVTYRKLKMFDKSMETLTQANRLLKGNVEVIYEIGQLAEAEGKKQEAIQIYKDALRFDPLYKDAADALERLQ